MGPSGLAWRCLLRAVILTASFATVICLMVAQGLVAGSQNMFMGHQCAKCEKDATVHPESDLNKPLDPNAMSQHLATLTLGALVFEGCCLLMNMFWLRAWDAFELLFLLTMSAFKLIFLMGIHAAIPFLVFLWAGCAPSLSCFLGAWFMSIPSVVRIRMVMFVFGACATCLLGLGGWALHQVFQCLRKLPWPTTQLNITRFSRFF